MGREGKRRISGHFPDIFIPISDCLRLPSLAPLLKKEKPTHVKMDVEGAEVCRGSISCAVGIARGAGPQRLASSGSLADWFHSESDPTPLPPAHAHGEVDLLPTLWAAPSVKVIFAEVHYGTKPLRQELLRVLSQKPAGWRVARKPSITARGRHSPAMWVRP